MSLDTPPRQLSLLDAFGEESQWVVRESVRARRLSARVFMTGRVEVVVPPGLPAREVQQFLARHRNWIERKVASARRDALPPALFPPTRLDLPGLGESWRIDATGGCVYACTDGTAQRVPGLTQPERAAETLQAFVLGRARAGLGAQLAAVAREMAASYGRIELRRQRTRWGSCSTRGTISLNVCLAFQRPAVVRYLLVHELAHTRHMNHSRRYWQLVGSHCAEYRSLNRELLGGWRHVPTWMFRA